MFSQFFVLKALLTQVTDLISELSLSLFSRKIGLKLVGVEMVLNLLTCGFCTSTMSQLLCFMLLSRSRCVILKLFRLICRMQRASVAGCAGWVNWVQYCWFCIGCPGITWGRVGGSCLSQLWCLPLRGSSIHLCPNFSLQGHCVSPSFSPVGGLAQFCCFLRCWRGGCRGCCRWFILADACQPWVGLAVLLAKLSMSKAQWMK